MTSRKKPTSDSGTGSSGRTSSGRTTRTGPAPSPTPKMIRRVTRFDGTALEPGDPVPADVDGETLKGWRALGWVDHG